MYKLTFFACFLALLSFSGCKEADITPDNNKEFPINIEVKQTSEGVEITWPEVKVNGFKNYFLIRRVDSTAVGNFFQAGDTVWVMEDFSKTKIIDKNLPLASNIYYQLTVETKDRVFKSQQAVYKRNDILSFENLSFDSKVINPIRNMVYLFSSNNGFSARAINTETGKISDVISFDNTVGKRFSFNQEDPDHIYWIGTDEILVYDAVTLTLKHTLVVTDQSTESFYAVTFSNGRYYATLNSYPTQLKVYDDKGNHLSNYKTVHNISSTMDIKTLPEQKRLLLFYGGSTYNEAVYINLDDNGNILSNKKVVDNSNNSPFNPNSCAIMPNGKNIIFSKRYVMDKDLKLVKTLSILNNFSSNLGLLYSPDSQYLIANESFGNTLIMDADTYKIIKTISSQNNSPVKTYFLTNTELVTIGEFFSNNSFSNKRLVITKSKFL